MKLKNFIFVTFFLAAASLGLALPPKKNAKGPAVKIPATNSTQLPTSNVQVDQVDQVEKVFTEAAGANGAISSDCAAALVQIISSPEFLKCVPPQALLPVAPIAADPSIITKFLADPANVYKTVLEKPLITFADTICAAPKCSDKGVAGAVQLLEQKCQKELKDNQFLQLIQAATILYSPIRDILCIKDKDKYCWDETLLGFTSLPKSPIEITKIPLIDSIAAADPQTVCVSCPQQIIGTFIKDVQSNQAAKDFLASQKISLEEIELGVVLKCGAKFLNPGGKNNEKL